MSEKGTSEPEAAEIPRRQLVASVILEEGKFLMVDNIKDGLRVEPTGGKIHPGETKEDAARREAREELGIEIEILRELGIFQTESPEGTFDVHTLLCRIHSGEPQLGLEPKKIGGFEWYTLEELRQCEALVPNMKAALGAIETLVKNP